MDRTQLQQLGLSASDRGTGPAGVDRGHDANLACLLAQPRQRGCLHPGRAVASICTSTAWTRCCARRSLRPRAGRTRKAPQLLGNLVTRASQRRKLQLPPAIIWRRQPIFTSACKAAIWAASPCEIGKLVEQMRAAIAARRSDRDVGPGANHELILSPAGGRPGDGGRDGVPVDCRQFSVLGGCLHHHHRSAGRAWRASAGCCC